MAFNAWATLEYGAGWWTRHDETDVLGKYKVYKVATDFVPTMHWEEGAGYNAVGAVHVGISHLQGLRL